MKSRVLLCVFVLLSSVHYGYLMPEDGGCVVVWWWEIYIIAAVVSVGIITGAVKMGSWGPRSWKLPCLRSSSQF